LTYQTFGGGGWTTDTGGTYALPTADEMTRMLERWENLVPSPAFDYAYSWGTQNGHTALEDSAILQKLFRLATSRATSRTANPATSC